MNLGGLGARAALKQKPTKPCNRCGLRYEEDADKCVHCGDISDANLSDFKEGIEAQKDAEANLGSIFLVITLALGILLFLLF